MNPIAFLLLLAAPVAQEDLDTDLERLAPKIDVQGVGATMVDLLKSDAGRLVIKEKIAALVAKAIERIDRDPQGQFERYLFAEEPDGTLAPRPERKRDLAALRREIERRVRAWKAFDQAGQEVASRIPETGALERKLKEYWRNPEFRLALYQRLANESREPDPEELWNRLIGRSLFRGNDGKLRLRGNYKDESVKAIAEVKGEAEGLAGVEEQLAKALKKLKDDDRTRCSTPEGRVVVAQRLAQLAGEGAENPVAKFLEEDLKPSLEEIAGITSVAKEVRPLLDEVARDVSDESEVDRNLKKALKDPRAVILLIVKMRAALGERQANRDAAIAQFRDDHFDSDESGAITLKKGRFVDDQGKDSVEALAGECDGILNEFAATRSVLDEIAERALDPALCELLQTREGASAFTDLQTRVVEDLKQAERDGAVRKFLRIYLEASGDRNAVRAERTVRVEEMARRAKEVRKALDAASREEVRK